MKRKQSGFRGALTDQESEREKRHREILKKITPECVVLLKNEGVLPLPAGSHLALFGRGAVQTVSYGKGSAAMNERHSVSIAEGLERAGFFVDSKSWLASYEAGFQESKRKWIQAGKQMIKEHPDDPVIKMKAVYGNTMVLPEEPDLSDADREETAECRTAVYVLGRQSGEGEDRYAAKGDYYLSDSEEALLTSIAGHYDHTILILNCSGIVDLSFLDRLHIDAVLQMCYLGMEGGTAIADLLSGKETPSGKLTDTWGMRYEDYPGAATFSHNNGNLTKEYYEEDIYVGYRYFDSFGVKPRFAFGYGLSYTEFRIDVQGLRVSADEKITLEVLVKNTGERYSGREVVQIYVSCPWGKLKKEKKRLCAFGKTDLLAPGQEQRLLLSFPVRQMTSYDSDTAEYVLEAGDYRVFAGNASDNLEEAGILRCCERLVAQKVNAVCPLREKLRVLEPEEQEKTTWKEPETVVDISGCRMQEKKSVRRWDERDDLAEKMTKMMSGEQLIRLVNGDNSKAQITTIGGSGISVPGSAGETSNVLDETPWNLPSIVFADGASGLRLQSRYQVDSRGEIIKQDFTATVEHGIFTEEEKCEGGTYYYQYCSAIPAGTALAQSFHPELLEECGKLVAREMEEMGIQIWLAPSLNIHRNPLCGRNFEYYSEDPLLSGVLAAAAVRGVQSVDGMGVTIKHFACNNQEDNRKGVDMVVSERALREIYLHGFEIAVKSAQPMFVMSAYNSVNGVHAANSADLLQEVLRREWGFAGVVVSDWITTGVGGSSPVGCVKAGNDLTMPGTEQDISLESEALKNGELSRGELEGCCRRIISIIFRTGRYEDCGKYGDAFDGLKPYITCQKER